MTAMSEKKKPDIYFRYKLELFFRIVVDTQEAKVVGSCTTTSCI